MMFFKKNPNKALLIQNEVGVSTVPFNNVQTCGHLAHCQRYRNHSTKQKNRSSKIYSLQPYHNRFQHRSNSQQQSALSTPKLKMPFKSICRVESYAYNFRKSPYYSPQQNQILQSQSKKYLSHCTPLDCINNKKKSLTLVRENKVNPSKGRQNHLYYDKQKISLSKIEQVLKIMIHKLRQVLSQKNSERFLDKLQGHILLTQTSLKQKQLTPNLSTYIQLLGNCFQRRLELSLLPSKQHIKHFQQENQRLISEVSKKNIRLSLESKKLEKEIEKARLLQQKLLFMESQMNCKNKLVHEKGVGTQDNSFTHNSLLNDEHIGHIAIGQAALMLEVKQNQCKEMAEQLREYQKIFKRYEIKEKGLMKILTVMKQEGIDVEKIHEGIRTGNIEVQEEQTSKSIWEQCKQENNIYKKYKHMELNRSQQADESIVSVEDGLSFNWDQKSIEADNLTIRQQYKSAALNQSMQKHLQLDFNVFYSSEEESGDSNSELISSASQSVAPSAHCKQVARSVHCKQTKQ